MKYYNYILILFAAILSIFILSHLEDNDIIDNYTLHAQGGCCSIHVLVKSNPRIGVLYITTYTDNITGDVWVEHDTHEADAEYIINMFQDVCMDNHQEE